MIDHMKILKITYKIIKVITGIDPYDDDEDDTLKVITGFDDTD